MKIKISTENKDKIEAALREVNGRSEAHAYTSYAEVAALAESAEKEMEELLYRKDWKGARWEETSGAKVANSYKGTRNGTKVTLDRGSKDWFLVAAVQVSVFNSGGGSGHLYLTPKQDEATKKRLAERYQVYG